VPGVVIENGAVIFWIVVKGVGNVDCGTSVIIDVIVVGVDVAVSLFSLSHPAVITTATSKTMIRRYFIPVLFI
jgi:hypothetical protein